MAGFGNSTDHFALATLITNANLIFVGSTSTPAPVTVERAQDEEGNEAAEDSYEGGPATAVECKYKLQGGTLDIDDLYLGPLVNGAVHLCAVSISVAPSNSDWPMITVSGFTGVTDYDDMPTFYLPDITINGKRIAQGLDFTVDSACRLTSSELSAEGEFHHDLDDSAEVGVMAFTGGTVELSGDAVEITDVVAWTPGGTWIETQAPGTDNEPTKWGTASFAATKILTKYVAP